MIKLNDNRAICFAAENTLGKLAKWLRILGFDTEYPSDSSVKRRLDVIGEDRILLTRTKQVLDQYTGGKFIFIKADDPFEQVKQVIQTLGIKSTDLRPFSRCTRCNMKIRPAERDSVQGRVPDYVWDTHTDFRSCHVCGRIYWSGSHIQRSYDIINTFFK